MRKVKIVTIAGGDYLMRAEGIIESYVNSDRELIAMFETQDRNLVMVFASQATSKEGI